MRLPRMLPANAPAGRNGDVLNYDLEDETSLPMKPKMMRLLDSRLATG